MIRKTLLAACAAAAALFAEAGNEAHEIWPKGKVALATPQEKPEHVEPMVDDIVRVANVAVPQVVVTAVAGAARATPAVVVCPGGGYSFLAWNHEGVEIAQWLKDQGVAAVILKYRVPDRRDEALADVQRAVRWTRAHAKEFNIDPGKIWIMGFSAGANLAVRTSTNFKRPVYEAVDEIDRESCRPDFQMVIYPWDLLERNDPSNPWKGHGGLKIRTADYPVDADTPRAFIVQSEDDFCMVETSLGYCAALKAAKVPVELHVFERGGHGYGIRQNGAPTDAWPRLAEAWLSHLK
ncbi:MAG: alpha/beta hydrolase [Kiritimatiellae bacterium]|nr:alpha/beta hydrolase [Kiritimatiellia bacterium]